MANVAQSGSMTTAEGDGETGRAKGTGRVPHARYFVIGLIAATLWTLVGAAAALWRGELELFVMEWRNLQAPFLIGLGTWLVLISMSGTLNEQAARLARNGSSTSIKRVGPFWRAGGICAIAIVGTASLVWMGFNAKGPILAFMW